MDDGTHPDDNWRLLIPICLRGMLWEALLIAPVVPIYLVVKAHSPDRTVVTVGALVALVGATAWVLALRDKAYLPSNRETSVLLVVLVAAAVALTFAWR